MDHELDHPDHAGVSRRELLAAMRSLEEAQLVREVTAREETRLGFEHHGHRLYVDAVDDLTAVTLLLSSC